MYVPLLGKQKCSFLGASTLMLSVVSAEGSGSVAGCPAHLRSDRLKANYFYCAFDSKYSVVNIRVQPVANRSQRCVSSCNRIADSASKGKSIYKLQKYLQITTPSSMPVS